MSLADTLAARLSRWVIAHAKAILIAALVIVIGGGYLGSKLGLETDLSELLPPSAESVKELKRLNQRVGGTGSVSIALAGDTNALRDYLPRLAATLRKELGPDLLSLKYQRREVDEYFEKFGAYYVPLDDLKAWSKDLDEVIRTEKIKLNPAYVDLDDTPKQDAKSFAAEVRTKKQEVLPKRPEADPQTGLLITENGHLAAIFVRPAANSLNLASSGALLDKLKTIVLSTKPPGVTLEGFTGSIPTAIAEFDAIVHDISSTALLVICLVGSVVILYFRGVRELFLMSTALIVGAVVAFAFSYLWIGHVNGQTAFLGSIIVGTGINYGIIMLASYQDRRRAGDAFEVALERALATTLRASWIAASATAVSFGVLAAGEVESFHQFGWIGGIGILACWAATFSVVPAALVVFDRNRAPSKRVVTYHPLAATAAWITRQVTRAPRLVILSCIAISAIATVIIWSNRHDALETDITKLATKSTGEMGGIAVLDQRLRKLDTGSSTPAVVPVDTRDEARQVCEVLERIARAANYRYMRRCFSVDALLAQEPAERMPLLRKLRAQVEEIPTDELSADEQRDLAQVKQMLDRPPPTIADLPATLVEPFVERDGSVGKLAFVEPHHDEIAQNLFDFADTLREIHLPSGKVIHASGENVVYADVLRAVARDAKRLTLAAAVLVLLLLGVTTLRVDAFMRVGLALIVGVVWMLGLAALGGVKLNFFNFVALPTTFGIGIDYAINVDERIRLRGVDALVAATREVGPPVILASSTTIFGYMSLLLADNQALASFGRLAILGELTCLVAALVLIPALWALRRRSSSEKRITEALG